MKDLIRSLNKQLGCCYKDACRNILDVLNLNTDFVKPNPHNKDHGLNIYPK